MTHQIARRESDGYINVLDICKDADRLFSAYLEQEGAIKFILALSEDLKLPIDDLMDKSWIHYPTQHYSHMKTFVLWTHPCVAVHFACHLSPTYFLNIIKWIVDTPELLKMDVDVLRKHLTTIELKPVVLLKEADDTYCSIL